MPMIRIGLLREGKNPPDSRVALTPAQCKWLQKSFPDVQITVQTSATRCFSDKEYLSAGVALQEDLAACDYIFGIKEVPIEQLIDQKTYLFFSHTKKLQPYNQSLFRAILSKRIRLIDYECLEHEDGQRIIGFGFFAGVVGAHNGIMAYGKRTGSFTLNRVYKQRSFRELIHTYFGLKLPPIKIAVTGSGRVAHGILEVMNLLGVHEVEPADYLKREYSYPVYTHLKGADLFKNKATGHYDREEFHAHHDRYQTLFKPYTFQTDILMNGIYWEQGMARLFEKEEVADPRFRIVTISDISDDANGSVPINLGDQSIEDPVYGVDKITLQKTAPYLPGSIDVMAVGNLPNELPRDASRYFGEQLIKFILEDLFKGGSAVIEKATLTNNGDISPLYSYMREYGGLSSDQQER
ncbi:MAG: alanine dehydrogenase [Sphingomonadales bacterium]|nr:alanine dehydrogenase [Sphingomonadales bacterium]